MTTVNAAAERVVYEWAMTRWVRANTTDDRLAISCEQVGRMCKFIDDLARALNENPECEACGDVRLNSVGDACPDCTEDRTVAMKQALLATELRNTKTDLATSQATVDKLWRCLRWFPGELTPDQWTILYEAIAAGDLDQVCDALSVGEE